MREDLIKRMQQGYKFGDSDVILEAVEEIESLRQQLETSQKREVMLRQLIPSRIPDGFVSFGKYYSEQEDKFNDPYNSMCKFKRKYLSDCEEALAATEPKP